MLSRAVASCITTAACLRQTTATVSPHLLPALASRFDHEQRRFRSGGNAFKKTQAASPSRMPSRMPSRFPLRPASVVPASRRTPTTSPAASKAKELHSAKLALKQALVSFARSVTARKLCEDLGISPTQFSALAPAFVAECMKGTSHPSIKAALDPKLLAEVTAAGGEGNASSAVLRAFLDYADMKLPASQQSEKFVQMRRICDQRWPHTLFPDARLCQRKIIMHVGPTNSGKTYHALQRLESVQPGSRGLYCSPLRLLAHEIYERMNNKGIPCDLLTGEDRRQLLDENGDPIARITSATVEMANLASHYSVVVIDEIQMIADSGRGWAWTAALLGLQADEIHLCGEPTAIKIVRKMMESAYDDVEIRQYDRLNKLEVEPVSLGGSYQNVKPGDCVVAFSRQEIFSVKNRIEKATGMKCAVIYGALPPETRAEQARLFNDPESGYDVIVASDAIGMGINLNIKRVVFSTVTKFDGRETLPIGLSMLRQIGGRAGRYGRSDGIGTVTAFEAEDLPAVKSGMATSPPGIARAGWKPSLETIQLFAHLFPDKKFSEILRMFAAVLRYDSSTYFLCHFRDNIDISEAIESVPLTVPERYLFMMAPCPKQVEGSRETIAQFARDRYEGRPCEIDNYVKLPETLPKTNKELKQVESMHKIVLMYMWLHFYFPDTFTTFERAAELKGLIEKQIVDGLQQLPTSRKQARGKKSLEEIL